MCLALGNSADVSAIFCASIIVGYVMSDWLATHSTAHAALAGLDQEMPNSAFFGAALATMVANGSVPMSRIDDMVSRMLVPM